MTAITDTILEAPDIIQVTNKPCTCWNCNYVAKNKKALNAHLANCPNRKHYKLFVCEKYIFGVVLNPRSKIIESISAACVDLKKPAAVVGLLYGYQQSNNVHSYYAVEHKGWLKEINHLRNGLVRAKELEKHLSKEDIVLLGKEYTAMTQHRLIQ